MVIPNTLLMNFSQIGQAVFLKHVYEPKNVADTNCNWGITTLPTTIHTKTGFTTLKHVASSLKLLPWQYK